MKRFLGVILEGLLLLIIALGFTALALRPPSDLESRRALVVDLAEVGVEKGNWPGIMWAEVAPGRVLFQGAAGFADLSEGRQMTPETTMPIASISKVIVGLAGADAIRRGALDPDAPLDSYLSFPVDAPDGAPRTFGQLATHTSGILDSDAGYEEVGYHFGATTHPMPLEGFLESYLSAGGGLYREENFADWAPGSRYEYSNIGAGLAAQAIADATGESFAEYSMNVLAPLGLSGGWGPFIEPPENAATLYRLEGKGFAALDPYALATWPDGQFNASAVDLARLLAAIMGEGQLDGAQVLDPETVALLTIPRFQNGDGLDDPDDQVGLFWTRETLSVGPISFTGEGHNGGDPGVFTMMYRTPGTDRGLVLMMNGGPRGFSGLIRLVRLLNVLAYMPAG